MIRDSAFTRDRARRPAGTIFPGGGGESSAGSRVAGARGTTHRRPRNHPMTSGPRASASSESAASDVA
jgi:hypothetical protein